MASVHPRKNRAGEITSYQVKWRLGGGRNGDWQTESFKEEPAAELFKDAVDEAGQQWPPGWVKGQGYIDPTADVEERYRFEAYALESIKNRTAVEKHYRDAIEKELRTYILPTFGNCDVRSTEHFSKRTISAWVNKMSQTKVWRGSVHKEMSPKTLKNLHGLLSSILKEAVQEEPPLRARNPCELVSLPRTDDDGVEDEGDEDMTFLLPEEVEAIVEQLQRPEDKRLVRVKYGTGFRWGEITALAKRHAKVDVRDGGKTKLQVSRAWKRKPGEGYYLGKPKSKRSRRTIRVSASTWNDLLDHGLEALKPGDLIFHNGQGERLPYSTFYDRWTAAVERAKEAGGLPAEKSPTLHDLRHSHAAALLSAGRGLTYVQRRLGHESITTTSDRYGHLLPEADDEAMKTIEATLGGPTGPEMEMDSEEVPYELSERAASEGSRRVYVVHFGDHKEGFWKVDDARAVAEQWQLDKGEAALVEVWSAAWWTRTATGGGRGGGLLQVRHEVPDRVQVWSVGPALYSADGTERVVRPEDHEPRVRWVWEWEEEYTDELFLKSAEWQPTGETRASAWGLSRGAVVAAYEQARADALRVCGLNPSATAQDGQQATA
jgi:integrase